MTTETNKRDSFTIEEVAAKMGIHEDTIRRWAREGKIPSKRVGGRWLIPAKRYQAWLDDEDTPPPE